MTQILVLNQRVLNKGPFQETETEIKAQDVIYPKSVIADYIFYEVVLPSDFEAGKYNYDGSDFSLSDDWQSRQLPSVPESVTRFQALAALDNAGYLDTIEAIMANSQTPKIQRLAYQNALNFDRNSATVAALGDALNLSSADIDQLFISAASITA